MVAVIGAGAAGMIAAYRAACEGEKVTIFEKNEKAGKKLYITGKGRCNVTNASDMDNVMQNTVTNPRFLYSAFAAFDNKDVMELIESAGCKLKTERGQRVFPVSDKSSDIINAFLRLLKQKNVEIKYNSEVEDIVTEEGSVTGVMVNGKYVKAEKVILASGGLSYPSTGSDGAGHRLAKKLGHTITKCYPALVPLVVKEEWPVTLQGLALKNVEITVKDGKKTLYSDFGEMLFTHFGISGPIVISASSKIVEKLASKTLEMFIDLKPALSNEQLDDRLLRDFAQEKNKQYKNALDGLFPMRMAEVMVKLSKIDPQKMVNSITKEERRHIVELTKKLPLTITGTRGYNEAIITHGGIKVSEINSKTMESKLVKGLYFAGEIIDIDAMTGGYNLQLAWSTGNLAGKSEV